jgi:LPS export ABC transporter protein LptC
LLGEHTAFISLTPLAGASILNSMKASAIKILSRLMIGLIVAVSLSVLINYLFTRYNRTQNVQKTPQVLDSEMVRSAEGLDYSDHRNGKLRFRIHAEKLLETNLGKSLLEGIEARDFNPDGSVRNEIRSKRAEYDRDRNLADFSGDVRVFFGDGIEMRTESLHYDLLLPAGRTPPRGRGAFYSRAMCGWIPGLPLSRVKRLKLLSAATRKSLPI